VNSYLYFFTYDANNIPVSDSYKEWNEAGTKLTYGDSTIYYFHVVGIKDLKMPAVSIKAYPNPSSDKISVETPFKGSLSILNLNGQSILQKVITDTRTTIDISGLPCGVYVVKIVGEKGVQVGKFVKQ
jgi:hypothetical protein